MSALLIVTLPIFEGNPTGDPVRSIFGNRDRRFAHLIDLITTLNTTNCIAERARGAGSHRGDDLLHPGTNWIDKGVLS